MFPDLKILFEDNHVLAVDKPAGMLSQGDLTGDLDVLTLAKEIIKQRDGKTGNVFLGLVQRLDRPVGGSMIIAKTSKAAGRLSKQFRERETKKIYRAVVAGVPNPQEGGLEHYLLKDRATRITHVVSQSAGGKLARMSYKVLETANPKSLLEVDLKTGLAHQIRAQLSIIGHPIVGDRKYNSKMAFEQGRIALYSHSITFAHPIHKEPVTVTAKPPSNWPWKD
jgi:23S rRNA pseudouridine1911/1915/1917 synthase